MSAIFDDYICDEKMYIIQEGYSNVEAFKIFQTKKYSRLEYIKKYLKENNIEYNIQNNDAQNIVDFSQNFSERKQKYFLQDAMLLIFDEKIKQHKRLKWGEASEKNGVWVASIKGAKYPLEQKTSTINWIFDYTIYKKIFFQQEIEKFLIEIDELGSDYIYFYDSYVYDRLNSFFDPKKLKNQILLSSLCQIITQKRLFNVNNFPYEKINNNKSYKFDWNTKNELENLDIFIFNDDTKINNNKYKIIKNKVNSFEKNNTWLKQLINNRDFSQIHKYIISNKKNNSSELTVDFNTISFIQNVVYLICQDFEKQEQQYLIPFWTSFFSIIYSFDNISNIDGCFDLIFNDKEIQQYLKLMN